MTLVSCSSHKLMVMNQHDIGGEVMTGCELAQSGLTGHRTSEEAESVLFTYLSFQVRQLTVGFRWQCYRGGNYPWKSYR